MDLMLRETSSAASSRLTSNFACGGTRAFPDRFRFSFCRTRQFATSWRWTISLKAAPLWLRCPIVTVFYSRSFRQSGKWK